MLAAPIPDIERVILKPFRARTLLDTSHNFDTFAATEAEKK